MPLRISATNGKYKWQIPDHHEAPLIMRGGIIQPEKACLNCKAGADVIVVGNAIEKDASLIKEMSDAVHSVPVKA